MQAPKHSDPSRQQTDNTFFETHCRAFQNTRVLYMTNIRLNYYHFHLKTNKQAPIKINRINQRRVAEDQARW